MCECVYASMYNEYVSISIVFVFYMSSGVYEYMCI